MSDQAVRNEKIIVAENICKSYTYYKKEAGLKGSIKNLFKREKLYKPAVKNLSFQRDYNARHSDFLSSEVLNRIAF